MCFFCFPPWMAKERHLCCNEQAMWDSGSLTCVRDVPAPQKLQYKWGYRTSPGFHCGPWTRTLVRCWGFFNLFPDPFPGKTHSSVITLKSAVGKISLYTQPCLTQAKLFLKSVAVLTSPGGICSWVSFLGLLFSEFKMSLRSPRSVIFLWQIQSDRTQCLWLQGKLNGVL